MPDGKPAGVRCIQLDQADRCQLFGRSDRPTVCSGLQPSAEMCGTGAPKAMIFLARLERLTAPAAA